MWALFRSDPLLLSEMYRQLPLRPGVDLWEVLINRLRDPVPKHFTDAAQTQMEQLLKQAKSEEAAWMADVIAELAGEDMDEAKQLSTYIWRQVLSEYLEIDACNVPGGETLPLPADSLRPVRPPSVPKF